jgi:hypothetical protein
MPTYELTARDSSNRPVNLLIELGEVITDLEPKVHPLAVDPVAY